MNDPIPEQPDPDGILWQRPLRNTAKPSCTDDEKFRLGFTIRKGLFAVYYESPRDTDLSIDIDKPKKVHITLVQPEDVFAWRWSTQFQAITRKRDPATRRHYKNLRYVEPNGSETPWMSGMSGNYETITFVAKKGKHSPEAHGFSMNVDFKVPGNNDKWLPVTIDPDIINPKVPNLARFVEVIELPGRDDVVAYPLFGFEAVTDDEGHDDDGDDRKDYA